MTNDAPPAVTAPNHEEARLLAELTKAESNLARCYLARDAEVARLTKERDELSLDLCACKSSLYHAKKISLRELEEGNAWQQRALAAEARLAEVEGALRPFASLGGPDPTMVRAFPDLPEDTVIYKNSGQAFTAGDVRRARVALGVTRPNPTPSYPGLPEGAGFPGRKI